MKKTAQILFSGFFVLVFAGVSFKAGAHSIYEDGEFIKGYEEALSGFSIPRAALFHLGNNGLQLNENDLIAATTGGLDQVVFNFQFKYRQCIEAVIEDLYNQNLPQADKSVLLNRCYYNEDAYKRDYDETAESELLLALIHLNLPPLQMVTGSREENIPLIEKAVEEHNNALFAARREAERLKEEHVEKELERLKTEGLY